MLIRYITKSVRAMVQGGIALVLAILAVALLFSTVMRWRYESTLRVGVATLATAGEGDVIATLLEARSMRPDDPMPSLFLGQTYLEKGAKLTNDSLLALAEKGKAPPKAEAPRDEKKDPGSEKKGDKPADEPAPSDDPGETDPFAGSKKALQSSIKYFEEAIKKRDDWGPGFSDSCVAGAACARLALADVSPTDRATLLDEVAKTLEKAKDSDDAEIHCVRVGLALAHGDLSAAQKALADASSKLALAGRAAVGSYYWHKGMVELLAKDYAALDDLRRAALFRSGSYESGRLVSLAIRNFSADPALAPKDPKQLEERCLAFEAMLQQRMKGGVSRWGFDKPTSAAAWNAVGLGFLRVPNPAKAQTCFQQAISAKDEPIYYVNNALTQKAFAENPPPEEKNPERYKNKYLGDAASALFDAVSRVFEKDKERLKGQEKWAQDLLLLAAGLFHASGRHSDGQRPVEYAHDKYGLDDKEYFRTRGALFDWAGRLDLATKDYKEAIARKHKDSYKMEIRVDLFERSRKR